MGLFIYNWISLAFLQRTIRDGLCWSDRQKGNKLIFPKVRLHSRLGFLEKGEIIIEPQVGDEIEFLGSTYEVLAPSGEPAWRWSDAFHTAYRIHAKNTGG